MSHGGIMARLSPLRRLLTVAILIAALLGTPIGSASVFAEEQAPAKDATPAAEQKADQPPATAERPPEKAAEAQPAPAAKPGGDAAAQAQEAAKQKAAEAIKAAEDLRRATQQQAQQRAQQQAQPQPAGGNIQIQIRAGGLNNRRVRVFNPGEPSEDEPVFFPADRATLQRLSKAQELLEQQRYGEAVRLLGDILEGPEDFFFQPRRDEPVHRSLKTEAQGLIGKLPAAGRASYELQYGALARQKLDEALASGDPTALAEVSRRFFHTKAGYEATRALADYHFDAGHPLSAALCLKRLEEATGNGELDPDLTVKIAACWVRAGMSDKAQETLARLPSTVRGRPVHLAGKAVPLFGRDEDALSWLSREVSVPPSLPAGDDDQWTMYRGNPSRNSISGGSSPLLSRRWAVKTSDTFGKGVEDSVAQLRAAAVDQGQLQLCSMHPLAVNDLVFMRTIGGLLAVNFSTGKRIWPGPVNDSIRQLIDPTAAPPAANQVLARNMRNMATPRGYVNSSQWLSQRLWDDATYGTLSSDGERVFCVEDVDETMMFFERRVVMPNGKPQNQLTPARATNRLAAYDIATEGKLKWEAGGSAADVSSELSGAYFLGPPLPLAGSVYAIGELKGEVRLVALDATNGRPTWSQQLAVLDTTFGGDNVRHGAGVSPSYSDGILVCPTSAGAIVALDLTTRSLLWGYQYARTEMNEPMVFRGGMRIMQMPGNNGGTADRWIDATVTVAGGRVLLTPPESNQLHCLNLLDGKLLWQKPREDGLYIGCVHGDKVLLIGRNTYRALNLADGETAWASGALPLPPGSSPSGRGFYNGQRYHLPLSTAEVAAIDVNTGEIVGRAKSRGGAVPGNLICHRGAVISQNVDVLERFDQRDDLWQQITATLGATPDDASALARRGELLLDEGNYRDAIDSLRRSYAKQADPRTRELLVDALLEGLRLDFAAYRDQLAEIEALADQPQQRGTFLRSVAVGYQATGNLTAAFDAYMRIADTEANSDELERADSVLSVRRERWVQARLKGVLDAARPAEREQMERTVRTRLDVAKRAAGTGGLRNFLLYFGSLPQAAAAREQLASRLVEEGALIDAEQLLRQLESSSDASQAGAATARLAAMLEGANRMEDAALCYRRLGEQFADVVCSGGATGRQIVATLGPKSEITRLLQPGEQFPVGAADRENTKAQAGVVRGQAALAISGPRGLFFDFMTAGIDPQQQWLLGIDSYGRERWRVSLRDPMNQNNFNIIQLGNALACPTRVSGHLMLVSLGSQIVAIDTLGGPGGDGARVLWRHYIYEQNPNMPFQPQPHMVQEPWATSRMFLADSLGRPLGNIGPLTPELACYQRSRSIVAVRPLTGETVWTRADVEPGSDIFGDDELLFVVAPDSEEAVVLRSLDGQEVGRRKVAPSSQRMTTVGRNVASWNVEAGRVVLRVSDPWDKKEIWRRQFDLTAKASIVADEAIGVMTRSGAFELLSLADGHALASERLAPDPEMNEIYVLRGTEHYVLAASHQGKQRNNGTRHGANGIPLITGGVHFFDRPTGKRIASATVDQQGLLLNQPAALPLVAFATNAIERRRNAQVQEGEILCLDKRSGRTLYNEKFERQLQSLEVVGDPERHQIALKTAGTGVVLSFTGQPFVEKDTTPDADSTKAGKAVLRGLQGWFQNMAPMP